MRIFSILLLLSVPLVSIAQNPAPAPLQSKRILVMNGRLHIGDGTVIENSAIGFSNGKFDLVGDATTVRINRSAYDTIIDASGKDIYPGLIALNTTIGLNEIEAVRATNDFSETGMLNPSVRSIVAYNTDSKVIPTVRCNGVLMAQIVPNAGYTSPCLSGQSSVVVLDAWNYEDAAYRIDEGLHLYWPSMRVNRSDEPGSEEKQRIKTDKAIAELHKLFEEARSYAAIKQHDEKNIHLESMRGLFNKSKKLYVHCDEAKEIIAAAALCKEFNMEMVLVGGNEAVSVIGLLKEQKIPVLLSRTHKLPPTSDAPIDQPFTLPEKLKQAGIPFAISVPDFWQVRNLSYQAGTASAYGLSKEEALKSITLDPARILGIDSTTGSIAMGKDATFLVVDGDLLDMRTSKVLQAFIQGRKIELDNIQSQLNRKYRDKYGLSGQ